MHGKLLYLHIGAPKTGSTIIQNILRTNKQLLQSEYDTLYLDQTDYNIKYNRTVSDILLDFAKFLDSLDHSKNIIYSYEGISSIFKFDIERAKVFLDSLKHLYEYKIIFYDREYQQLLESAYKTQIIKGFYGTKEDFLEQFPFLVVQKCDFSKLIDDNWVICKYSKLSDYDFIRQFLNLCNINCNNLKIEPNIHNRTPDDEYLSILLRINKYAKKCNIDFEKYQSVLHNLTEFLEGNNAW